MSIRAAAITVALIVMAGISAMGIWTRFVGSQSRIDPAAFDAELFAAQLWTVALATLGAALAFAVVFVMIPLLRERRRFRAVAALRPDAGDLVRVRFGWGRVEPTAAGPAEIVRTDRAGVLVIAESGLELWRGGARPRIDAGIGYDEVDGIETNATPGAYGAAPTHELRILVRGRGTLGVLIIQGAQQPQPVLRIRRRIEALLPARGAPSS